MKKIEEILRYNGIRMDIDGFSNEGLSAERANLEVRIQNLSNILGRDVNITRNKELYDAFMDYGIEIPDFTMHYIEQHQYDDPALYELSWAKYHYNNLRRYSPEKIIEALGDDGRVHPQWRIAIETTSRLICSKPALQALPSDYRKYFVPDEGCCFVTIDFKSIDLRVLAKQSGDKALMGNLAEGNDIHVATAASIFKVALGNVTKAQRQIGKRTNFAITYGCSEYGLANMLSVEGGSEVSPEEAKRYISGFMMAYPRVSSYQWKLRNGKIAPTTIGGKSFDVGGRKALNYPIQGSTAEGFIKVLYAVQEQLGPTDRLVMAIHDSITIECNVERKDEVTDILVTTALTVMGDYLYPVPVFVDIYNHI